MKPRALPGLLVTVVLVVPTLATAGPPEQPAYDDFFTDEALRVDLIHSGTAEKEIFGIDEIVAEPIWPGPRVHLIDPTGYGKYRFRVFDAATGREIFSQGYCTLFGEWLTTGEAKRGVWRSMSEPLRMPYPKVPIELVVEGRSDKTGEFVEIQRLEIDTTAYDVRREKSMWFDVLDLHNGGADPAAAVDVVIVPDGYTEGEAGKLDADARRFARVLLEHPPFDRHHEDIAVRLVQAYSRESGQDEPRKGIYRDTVVDTTFDTFRSPRYLTAPDMKVLREVASVAPYDTIFVMVNSNRYGGGGIFGTFSVFTSDSEYSEYVMIHEFGHGFGGLGDEYYSSSTGYDEFYKEGSEPWEPNVTANTDAATIKWMHLITDGVPIPTPDEAQYNDAVGLFEGAGYKAKGLFRPTRDSKMFHKGLLPFGPVNEAAIETMMAYYTGGEVL
ncbi:MAG: peptidase M64 [Deltaproteobacteria bacterium]|nr:peptidase M64 [Deltaproteobacteria bacterium]